ncbi:MAG TPA: ABC transporter ATP-binding protein [Bosea sp. (in: a-proteobacteria)]|jgi:branched-chain amino acid transport system ATP-binding protein|nr:ABC transporter ATP-binding protein [Bosea sp. (in: a-proteobacteria)]
MRTGSTDGEAADDFILVTKGLAISFGGFRAVDAVDVKVRRGTIHAIIGPNGAGKTTFFNLLTKFLAPTAGSIRFNGHDITRSSPSSVARLGMIRSFQISATFPQLTVLQNVRIALQSKSAGQFAFWRSNVCLGALDGRATEILEQVGLQNFRDSLATQLSYGRQRILELATTLATDPEVLLLDEPMAGLGHEDVDRVSSLIRRVAAGRTVVMVEHNLSVVASLSDVITVFARGRVLAEGSYATVSSDPRVVEAYIGTPHA